ncbi:DUF1997 domain-containing protein [Spirulina subsalsa FACHB-351]|uniref:DUF1997 domain-containing protein n=1 Tax=Spirulina subsalsa FACHB-351 TaxID=234711 RepID=A0ABT3L3T1_9CYAN|nr:DUF1997 domain-containing protein [Spirulina subsalsa FACHB-351]
MSTNFRNHHAVNRSSFPPDFNPVAMETNSSEEGIEEIDYDPFTFETHFHGGMGMYDSPQVVAEYLDAHEGWFTRCAKPMTAEPFGVNGYILTIGRFGAFGYEVEPKMGVVLAPPENQIYDMYSVPVPDYTPPGYDVDYFASMRLAEVAGVAVPWNQHYPEDAVLTQVTWHLHLKVMIEFPKFIYKFPRPLLQNTGDRLLAQIVRQISPRLTYKVQRDFHKRLGLPLPPKQSRYLRRLGEALGEEEETPENPATLSDKSDNMDLS